MMKALLIEDETAAALNLAAVLRQVAPGVEVVGPPGRGGPRRAAGAGAAGPQARARAAAAGAAAATSPCAKLDAQFGGRWEIDPEDTGARLGQDGSTVDVRPEDWKTLFRDGDEEKGGAR